MATLEAVGLTKSFGRKRVLESVDLAVESGEIHALLGPNGSGKSTLIGCLSGALVPDAGTIRIGDVEQQSFSPQAAIAAGSAVIYQNFSLVPNLTVADNVFLGDEIVRGGRVDHAAQREATAGLLATFRRPIRADQPVSTLGVGDRQLVEIAKALHRRPKLLILDEPTAALGEQEASALGQHLRRLRSEGLAILYVTHILPEVFSIGDRVTVMRDGRVVLAAPVKDLDPPQVIEAISPARTNRSSETATRRADDAEALLEVSGLKVDDVGPIDLQARRGEVLAIFGLLGSGRTEIVEGIYGARPITAGTFGLRGQAYVPRDPAHALREGIALVAGDRRRQSIFDKLPALDNVLLPHFARLARGPRRRTPDERQAFAAVADQVNLSPREPRALGWSFSGGNQQKLAVGRWLAAAARVDVLLLDEPTQGIDVGARGDLYALLSHLAHDEGKAIVFTSSDPAETVTIADRIIVLRRGRIVDSLDGAGSDERRLLTAAHGAGRLEEVTPISALGAS
ncbi:MAG TPA: sugar ABC transporter ATP-binding protein [Candidatus Limnocylindrales bacterium]|nr:sugar ABC transporter ATP-binding protein [Candidatus Limnocylindrales bacterium]